VPRPKEFDPESAVVEAMEVFWAQGYSATSPQQLADRLRIGKGSLYNAFGGKRQLFDLAFRHYLDQRIEGLKHWSDQTGPAKGRLREALLFFVEIDPGHPDRRGCLATNSAIEFGHHDEAVASQIRSLFWQAESVFQSLIEHGQRAGEIRRDLTAEELAGMLLTATTGLHVLSHIETNPVQLARIVDTTLALL
jgi:TetR/AcrR family transcriptional repressor of nem operon